jgi:hypothetical protein
MIVTDTSYLVEDLLREDSMVGDHAHVLVMRMSAPLDLVASYDKGGAVICGTLRACRISCR